MGLHAQVDRLQICVTMMDVGIDKRSTHMDPFHSAFFELSAG